MNQGSFGTKLPASCLIDKSILVNFLYATWCIVMWSFTYYVVLINYFFDAGKMQFSHI